MTTWGALKNQLLDPPERYRTGIVGLMVVLLAVAVGQTITSVPMLFASPSYFGQFSNTGGLKKGDRVRITGMNRPYHFLIIGDHTIITGPLHADLGAPGSSVPRR